jgi:NADPH:quinone reductase-like Zn-dependent oxidoreductase
MVCSPSESEELPCVVRPTQRLPSLESPHITYAYGAKAEGSSAALNASVLAELATLIASGDLEVPIAATFPLNQVRAAFSLLGQGHIRGKIVLLP